MEVTSLGALNSHVIIGGGKAEKMQIANTREFFTVLSSTLYGDKMRAVVRETMTNAWDAHAEAGISDKPIEITLNEEALVFRDHGTGVAPEKMISQYGTYGASTRNTVAHVTGGFGLGAKAPFAYSDHFTVTTNHKGTKTTYIVSKGNEELNGEPSIVPVLSIPTEDTGLEVSIPVKDGDMYEFLRNIKQVASHAGKPILLNGDRVNSGSHDAFRKIGYMIVNRSWVDADVPFHVLLGDVLYPIASSDKKLKKLLSPLNPIVASLGRKSMVFFAEPGSIGVVPSREALSYTEKTFQGLRDTIQPILDLFERDMQSLTEKSVAQLAKGFVKNGLIETKSPENFLPKPEDATPREKALYPLLGGFDYREHGELFFKYLRRYAHKDRKVIDAVDRIDYTSYYNSGMHIVVSTVRKIEMLRKWRLIRRKLSPSVLSLASVIEVYGGVIEKNLPIEKLRRNPSISNVAVISETLKAANEDTRVDYSCNDAIFFRVPDGSRELRTNIANALSGLGFKVIQTKRVLPEGAKRAEPTFYTIKSASSNSLSRQQVCQADFFIKQGRSKRSLHGPAVDKACKKWPEFAGAARVSLKADVDRLKKGGSKDIKDFLLKKYKEVLRKKGGATYISYMEELQKYNSGHQLLLRFKSHDGLLLFITGLNKKGLEGFKEAEFLKIVLSSVEEFVDDDIFSSEINLLENNVKKVALDTDKLSALTLFNEYRLRNVNYETQLAMIKTATRLLKEETKNEN